MEWKRDKKIGSGVEGKVRDRDRNGQNDLRGT
jgi:hypothetical protein